MPEQKRTNWVASHRYNYTGVDRYVGDAYQQAHVYSDRSGKKAHAVAALLNDAYQTGREEMMAELAELFAQEGGQFYINQMLMAANGPADPVIITRMVTERVDVAPVQKTDDRAYVSGGYLRDSKGKPIEPVTSEADHNPSLGCCAEHFNMSGRVRRYTAPGVTMDVKPGGRIPPGVKPLSP